MSPEFPVTLLCEVLEISRSSFYEWRSGLTYQDNAKAKMMEMRAIAVFWENKRRYGARRVSAALQQQGIPVSLYKARSILKSNGLTAIQPKSFVPKTTNSKHAYAMSPNLLLDRPFPSKKRPWKSQPGPGYLGCSQPDYSSVDPIPGRLLPSRAACASDQSKN